MTTIFGRNNSVATGPAGDVPIDASRFYALADDDDNLAVYDSHTGLYAKFHGDTAALASDELNQGIKDASRYQWEDSL